MSAIESGTNTGTNTGTGPIVAPTAEGEGTLTTTDNSSNSEISLASTVVKAFANSIFTFFVILPVIVSIGGKQKSKKLNK